MKKKIITGLMLTILSFNLSAQQSGYLDGNSILSSFANELSIRLAEKLSKSETEKLESFKKTINDKLEASQLEQVIYFKTADNKLNNRTHNYFSNVVLSLNNYKNLNYTLIGHADIRGDKEYNLNLAQERINEIKALLINLNISEDNIFEINRGVEESKVRENVEDYFYDRKVQIIINKKQ